MARVRTPSADGATDDPALSTPAPWEQLGFAPWVEPAYRRWRPALPVLGIYALVRVGLLVADALAGHLAYGANADGPLTAWDGSWYLFVAAHGYPATAPSAAGHLTYSAAGFEPLFPALIRAVQLIGLSPVGAALFVSLVAGALSVLLVWRLGAVLYDERVGVIAAILFCLFPGMGVCWGMTYSECTGLALAAGCLLLMVQQRWVGAGLIGLLATATSPMALPLALAALVPVVQALRRREFPRALITVVLVPLGFVAYVGYLGLHYHDWLFWERLQHQAWGVKVDFGRSLLALLVHPWSGGYQGKGWMEWVGVVVVAGAVVALVKARPPLLITVYCGGLFVFMFVSNNLGFKPRFVSWAFPALIAVAAVTRRRGWQPIAIAFAMLLPVVFLAYATLGNYMIQP